MARGFPLAGRSGRTLGGRVESGNLQFSSGGTVGLRSGTLTGTDYSIVVGRTRADFTEPPIPTFIPGQTASIPLNFRPESSGGLPDATGRYNQLRDRVETVSGDGLVMGTASDGTPYYRENHNEETLLVRVVPGRDLTDTRPVWAVIAGGEDRSTSPGTWRRYIVELFVIAELDEYDSANKLNEVHER